MVGVFLCASSEMGCLQSTQLAGEEPSQKLLSAVGNPLQAEEARRRAVKEEEESSVVMMAMADGDVAKTEATRKALLDRSQRNTEKQQAFERSLCGHGLPVFIRVPPSGIVDKRMLLLEPGGHEGGGRGVLVCSSLRLPLDELENVTPGEMDAQGRAWLELAARRGLTLSLRLPTAAQRDAWRDHLRAMGPGGSSMHRVRDSIREQRDEVRALAIEKATTPAFGPSSARRRRNTGDDDHSMAKTMKVQAIDPEQYRGLLDAGLISQTIHKNPGEDSVFREHSALAFDCGTGETKVLKLAYTSLGSATPGTAEAEREHSNVTVTELVKVPAVLDFLGGKIATQTKDSHSKRDWLELDEGECEDEGGLDETLSADDFVRFARQQIAKHRTVSSMIGTSAWSRQQRFKKEAQELSHSLVQAGIRPTKLTQSAEAAYEAAAVVYAAEKMGLEGVTGVIGSGGGSVQYLKGLKDAVLLDVGWRVGKVRLAAAAKPLAELDAWTSEEVTGKLGVLPESDRKRVCGRVVAISACYYAACIEGVDVASMNDAAVFYKVTEVVARMRRKLEELKQQVRDDPRCLQPQPGDDDKAKKNRGNHAMNLCNLTLQTTLYELFFDDECEICFKRGWQMPDGSQFTTTWTAGWYLHLLAKQGITFGHSCMTILRNLDEVDNDTVVFDCGTGETKALKFSFQPNEEGRHLALARLRGISAPPGPSDSEFLSAARLSPGEEGEARGASASLAAGSRDAGSKDQGPNVLDFTGSRGADPGAVVFSEVRKAPAVLDFLKGKLSTSTKDGRPKREFMNIETGKAGVAAAAADGGGGDEGSVSEDMLSPADFVAFTEQVVEAAEAKRAVIGTSSWHRTDRKGKAASLVSSLTQSGTVCKKLDNKEEAFFESAAVAYAAQKLGVQGITGVIGSGGGSVQYVKEFEETRLLEVGWRAGKESLELAERPLEELAKWTEERVMGQMQHHGEHEDRLTGKVVAISACYYAASITGVDVASKDDEAVFHKVSEVVQKMEAKLEELKQQVRDDPTCLKATPSDDKDTKKKRGSHAMDLCNLTLQTILYKKFFRDDCEICFKRNWVLPGGIAFRTTWSAGWYLQHLRKIGVTWAESDAVLEKMDSVYEQAREHGEMWRSERGKQIGAQVQVAMRLVDLKDITAQMLARAARAEHEVTADLVAVVEQCGGRMDGLAFRLKSEQSLFRKLISKLDQCLQDNTSSPGYTPTVEEIICNVDDCLRYTVVFPFEKYTAGVRAVESHLARKVYGCGSESEVTNNFANYWHEDKGKTTYMGINSWITTAVDDKAYTWELQFHTEEGIKLKMHESHVQYEIIRAPDDGSPAALQKKQAAYDKLKELWEKIPKPPGAHNIGVPTATVSERIRTASMKELAARKASTARRSNWWPHQQFVIADYEKTRNDDVDPRPLPNPDDGSDVQQGSSASE